MLLENNLSYSTSSLKKWLLRLIFSGLIIGAMVAQQMQIASSMAQESKPRDGSRISLLVEKGFVLPPQSLAILKSPDGSTWERGRPGTAEPNSSIPVIFADAIELPRRLKIGPSINTTTFTISGGARFESQIADGSVAVAPIENGVITTPTIVAGSQDGEGFIQVLVDGQPILENLRVATLEVGDIEKLKNHAPDGAPALLVSGDHFAVLDASKAQSGESVLGQGADPAAPRPGPSWPGPSWPGPSDKEPTKQEEAASPGDQVEALSLDAGVTFDPNIATNRRLDPDGRLEIFAVGRGGSPIYYKRQLAANSGWSAWKSLQGATYYPISVVRNQDGRSMIFVRGTDDAVYYNFQTKVNDPDSWSGWWTLGKPFGKSIFGAGLTAVLNGAGRIEVFVRAYNNGDIILCRAVQTFPNVNGFGAWDFIAYLENSGVDKLDAALDNAKSVWVFSDHEYFVMYNDGSPYYYLHSSSGMSEVAVQPDKFDLITVVGLRFDQELWARQQASYDTLNEGIRLGNGLSIFRPALVKDDKSGRLAAFVHGIDNRTYWCREKNPGLQDWKPWSGLGGIAMGDPAAAVNEDGRWEVFVLGTDYRIYHAYEMYPNSDHFTAFVKLLP